jgi:hypothetical protein
MTLKEFIDEYIERNSMVRILYKDNPGSYRILLNDWDEVSMEWEIVKGQGRYAPYINHEVIGIACISVTGPYSSAINIVIEEIPLHILREKKLQTIL